MIPSAIEAINLTKVYKLRGKQKEVKALDGLNLSIKKGQIFGLVGPNGAGKTTLIDILTTIRSITSGEAYIDGFNIQTETSKAKARISLMIGAGMNYTGLTGYSNLKFYAKIYKVKNYQKKIEEFARTFEMQDWLDQYVSKYSSGMTVKLAVIRTLLIDRPILLLDEPTRGLDVKARALLINEFKNMDKTILITSHNMDIIDKLCKRIAFINNGKIIKVGSKEELRRLFQKRVRIFIGINENKNQLKNELGQYDFIKYISNEETGLKIEIVNRIDYNKLFPIFSKYKILNKKSKKEDV
ncbi:hypothetical protein LCGC14_2023880 [marine sediment metagenome]|uniref:ABC transporter domain-containing protein n=1 Tax=marine sediment metagenome TaxID=412755 RepID=A0A0F9EWV7_9ZZZZ